PVSSQPGHISQLRAEQIRSGSGNSGVTASSPSGGAFSLHSVAEVSPGMVIEHGKFGRGVIEAVDTSGTDARIVVRFDSTDTRTLMLKFAKFAIKS
ncbi:MAG: hypothetical protein K2I35_01610, partial [Duncaniella sp.]|nr:hypothetical protein [Duncaniella sp.]